MLMVEAARLGGISSGVCEGKKSRAVPRTESVQWHQGCCLLRWGSSRDSRNFVGEETRVQRGHVIVLSWE